MGTSVSSESKPGTTQRAGPLSPFRQFHQAFRIVRLKDERLARKMTLAFGFMAFIPLLLVVATFLWIVFPNVQGDAKDTLRLLLVAIIASIFVGYFVLRWTVTGVLEVVNQARSATKRQLVESQ